MGNGGLADAALNPSFLFVLRNPCCNVRINLFE